MAIEAKEIIIVGGGITGLAAAYYLKRNAKRPVSILLIEQASRPGGKISTERYNGFLVETGPESFVSYKPAGVELCKSLGLESELLEPNPENKRTFVLLRNRLEEIPDGFFSLFSQSRFTLARILLQTRTLSVTGKLRTAFEPFIPKNTSEEDESIESFFLRRVGKEFFDNLLGPLFSGLYGAEVGRLSMKSLLPPYYDAEKKYGSLFGALHTLRGAAYGKQGRSAFVTLRHGLSSLIEKLTSSLNGDERLFGRQINGIEKKSNGYEVTLDNQEKFFAAKVLLTVPALASAGLLKPIDRQLSNELSEIPYASSGVFTFGFRKEDLQGPLQGYGFIVSRREKLPITACTWSSSKWPDRAPEGSVLLRCYPSRPELSGGEQQIRILNFLKSFLRVKGEPVLALAHFHPSSMPQYVVGHEQKLEAIQDLLFKHKGLFLAGSSYTGVGIPDCIEAAKLAATNILTSL